MNIYLAAGVGVGALLLAATPARASIDYDYDEAGSSPVDYTDASADNVNAFLEVIKAGESDGNYSALYGGAEFESFSNHPTIDQGYAGAIVAGRPTHPAGAYQFQPQTWREASAALGLSDFSPENQDRAAIFLIRRRGALDAVKAGDIPRAMQLLRNEWTSLADRGETWVRNTFTANGGTTA